MNICNLSSRWLGQLVLGVVLLLASAVKAENQASGEDAASDDTTTVYAELDPTFVTNVGVSGTGRLAYVKTDVALQVKGVSAQNAVLNHKPALRSIIIFALSRQDASTVGTAEGREALKAEALKELQAFLLTEEDQPLVEDLLFTNFIVQL